MADLSVDKVFQFVQFVSNKESRGWVSPEEFNLAAEVAQLTLYSELEGIYAATKKIEADLRPFVQLSTSVSDADNPPSKFRSFTSIYIGDGETNQFLPITEVDLEEVPYIINSTVNPPTATYPILYIKDNELRVLPNTIVFDFSYLTAPTAPEWGYTVVSGRPVYAVGSSTQFGFDETLFTEISMRVLNNVGVNIGKEEVTQYAMASKAQG